MKSYKGRGVVLHTFKYGDKSMVAHLLTDVGGRVSFMVQGVRSQKGKGSKAALFQPLFPVEFEGLSSSKMQMHRFKEVRSGVVLHSLPFDIRKSTIALFMAEVLYRLIKESEPNPQLFDYVWHSVGALDQIVEGVANFHLWWLVHLSRMLGFYPSGEYKNGCYFDIKEGCYTSTQPDHNLFFTPDNSEFLRDFTFTDVESLAEIGMNRGQRVRFMESMLSYYGYHLDAIHSVQSVEILQEVF